MHNRDRCLMNFCWIFILLTAIVTGSSLAKPMGKVIYDNYGFFDTPYIHYNVKNTLNFPFESSKVYVSFPELDAHAYTRSRYTYDIDPGEVRSQFLFTEFGGQKPIPGWYYARVVFSFDTFRDVRYIPVYMG